MEEKQTFESATYEEDGNTSSDNGWQKVRYPKRRRKSQPSKPSPDLDREKSRSGAVPDGSNVFRSLEEQAEERIRLRALQESQKAAAETASSSKPSASGGGGSSFDDVGGDSDGEITVGVENKAEVKKPKQKKPKKPKVTVAEAAAKIDACDLADFLAVVSMSYEDQQFLQMMRFADYFARAFSSISASQFPWTKMLKESTVAEMTDMPLCYISEPVYETSVDWISKRSAEALGEFFLWSLDCIVANLANQRSFGKSSKKPVQHAHPKAQGLSVAQPNMLEERLKAQVAIFVVLAMVLRRKPDVLISNIETWVDDYIGDDKVPLHVWVISQACVGDLVAGMHSWVHKLLPPMHSELGCDPQLRELILQLVERILSAPKARPILFNGVVRKGERLVPPWALGSLMQVTFPASCSRIKSTERFEAIYPTLKELALAGSPGTKALKQVSQQLLDVAVRAMSENIPELSKEAAAIFLRCLAQNADCYEQWEKLHVEKIEASVTVLQMLAGQWKEHAIRLSPLDNMKGTLQSLRLKNAQMLAGGADSNSQAYFKDADKYCEVILGRLTRRVSCMRSGVIVLTLAIATGAIFFSPSMDSWNWKNLHVMFGSSVLKIK